MQPLLLEITKRLILLLDGYVIILEGFLYYRCSLELLYVSENETLVYRKYIIKNITQFDCIFFIDVSYDIKYHYFSFNILSNKDFMIKRENLSF